MKPSDRLAVAGTWRLIAESRAHNREEILGLLRLFAGPLTPHQRRTLADVTAEVGIIETTAWREAFGAPLVLGET